MWIPFSLLQSRFCQCPFWIRLGSNKITLRPSPHVGLKKEIFSPFQTNHVHTLRFWIVFARAHENAIVTKNSTLMRACAVTGMSQPDVIRFLIHLITRVRQNGVFKISTMERVFEKMLFRWSFSRGACGREGTPQLKISVLKQRQIRLDGRSLNAYSKW